MGGEMKHSYPLLQPKTTDFDSRWANTIKGGYIVFEIHRNGFLIHDIQIQKPFQIMRDYNLAACQFDHRVRSMDVRPQVKYTFHRVGTKRVFGTP
jgi:hypothetical protein